MKVLKNHKKMIFTVAATLALGACGQTFQKSSEEKKSGNMTSVPVGFAKKGAEKGKFSLTEAKKGTFLASLNPNYTMSLDGCDTGLTGTITDATPSVNVYVQDRNCLVKLTQFVLNANTYEPSTDFTTWLAGDKATFTNSGDSTDVVTVQVVSQLSSPAASSDSVQYIFSVVAAGGTETIDKTIVGQTNSVAIVGQDAPDFSISAATFGGVTATGGAGQFSFALTCNSAMVGTMCGNVDLSQITYALVQNNYVNGVVRLPDADAIFASGGTAVDNQSTDGNGGFSTSMMTGPNQMHANPNMVLVLRANGLSYQYFDVNVTTLTNP